MSAEIARASRRPRRVPLAHRVELVLAHVPGTGAYRSRLRRTAARFVGNRVFWFMHVETLAPEVRRELLPEARRSIKRLARAWLALEESARLSRVAGAAAVPVGMIVAAAAAAGRIQPDLDLARWVVAVLLWAAASVVLLSVAFAQHRAGVQWFGKRGRAVWLTACTILAGAAVVAIEAAEVGEGSLAGFVVLGAALAVVTVTLLVVGIGIVARAAAYVSWRYAMLTAAQSLVIDALIAATVEVERYSSGKRNKPGIMHSLETAAITLERELPRGMPSSDPSTDAWIREHANAAAAALRTEKRAVFALRDGGDPMLSWRLARTLERVVRRDYAGLERAPTVVERQSRRGRVASFAGTLILAALPVTAVVVLEELSGGLDGPLRSTLLTVSIAWAAVTLLSRFDPLFGSKLAALKDTSELLRTPKP
jgi:hypothetical protein